jgi:photosystem II stability/assembly factor-like uncharacterized protein
MLCGALLPLLLLLGQRGGEWPVSRLFVATSEGPHRSYSWGEDWDRMDRSLPRGIRTFACLGPRAFAGGVAGLLVSENYGESWRKVDGWPGASVRTLLPSSYFALEPVLFVGSSNGLYRSRDGGDRFERVGAGVIEEEVWQLAWPGPELFAAGSKGVFRSEDGGDHWRRVGQGLPEVAILSLVVSQYFAADPVAFAGSAGAGLYRSRDGARTFERVGDSSWDSRQVYVLFWWERSLFAGTDAGLFYSIDAGRSFKLAGKVFENLKVYALAFPGAGSRAGSDILAGTERGVFKSSDGGLTWRHLTQRLGEPEVSGFGSFPFPRESLPRRRQ